MSGEEQSSQYHRAAKFPREKEAGAVYFRIQKFIDNPDADLSVYRLQLRGVWHGAVVGDAPGNELAEELEKAFATGELVDLPGEVLDFMWRRAEQSQRVQWVEGHYRPGRRFRFRK